MSLQKHLSFRACTYDELPTYSATSREDWLDKLNNSKTVYVGNLAFHTSEDQLYELFHKCGRIKEIVLGLNSQSKSPCGFCFVRFNDRQSATNAVNLINGAVCDSRAIRVDWDTGVDIHGQRKYGRGVHGMQWRDEFRENYDADRGGEGGGLTPYSLASSKRPYSFISTSQRRSRYSL